MTAVEAFVLLIAGSGLLLARHIITPEWPWELKPFNALLLGSIYSASMLATVMTVYVRRWIPARIVMPMIFEFTAIVLVVSLLNLDRFDAGKFGTWLWFALYIAIPVNAIYHIWLWRGRRPIDGPITSRAVRGWMLIPAMVLGIYGIGLLIAPGFFSEFWPWGIDDFHGRMYSVLYITPALGCLLLWKSAAKLEMVTLGITVGLGGFIPLIGLGLVDRSIGAVDFSVPGTWAWLASFAILFATGLALLWGATARERG